MSQHAPPRAGEAEPPPGTPGHKTWSAGASGCTRCLSGCNELNVAESMVGWLTAGGDSTASSASTKVRAAPESRFAPGVLPCSRSLGPRVEVSIAVSPGDAGTEENLGMGMGHRGVKGRGGEVTE